MPVGRSARRDVVGQAVFFGESVEGILEAGRNSNCVKNYLDRQPLPPFIVQSHRGAGNLAAENTLEAFELAWALGAAPEADVRQTKDDKIVAFHDSNFRRIGSGCPADIRDLSIEDLDWDRVSAVDVGEYKGEEFQGLHIPQIREALELLAEYSSRMMYLDVKRVDLGRLAAMAVELGVERQVILASTRYEELREWKRLLAKSNTLLWMGADESVLRRRIDELKSVDFADISHLQIHVNVRSEGSSEPFDPSDAFLREVGHEVKSRGMLYQVFVKDKADADAYRALLELGVESFATDEPLVALQVLRETMTV